MIDHVHDKEMITRIRSHLNKLGCSSEWFGRLIAVNVPENASLRRVQTYLANLKKRKVAGYEEPILRQ